MDGQTIFYLSGIGRIRTTYTEKHIGQADRSILMHLITFLFSNYNKLVAFHFSSIQ